MLKLNHIVKVGVGHLLSFALWHQTHLIISLCNRNDWPGEGDMDADITGMRLMVIIK